MEHEKLIKELTLLVEAYERAVVELDKRIYNPKTTYVNSTCDHYQRGVYKHVIKSLNHLLGKDEEEDSE